MKKTSMSMRTKIGVITIVLWIGILFGLIQTLRTGNTKNVYSDVCNRMGILMLFLWIAWPEMACLPRWFYAILPVVLILAAWRPYILIFAIPLLLFFLFLIVPQYYSSKKKKK